MLRIAIVDDEKSVAELLESYFEQYSKENNISYNVTQTQKQDEYVFHIYSKNQTESQTIKAILNEWKAKYIVHEESVKL